jgi:hypothetical protein
MMAKKTGKYGDFVDRIKEWQAIENDNIERTDREVPETKNPLIRTMLQALRLEAEKRRLLQQMVIDSVQREAVNLSPDELGNLSGHINRHMEAEEKALSIAMEALDKSELTIPSYLLSYLIGDLKNQKSLLRQFDDKLKNASVPTSATGRTYGTSRAA